MIDKFMATVRSIVEASLNRPVTFLMELSESVSKEAPARANKWSVSIVGVAWRNRHVCRCFGTGCLATVTAISHGRNLRPNPIRSGHYWEMRWWGSDGEREDREGRWLERKRERRWKQMKRGEEKERERGSESRRERERDTKMTGKWEAWMTSWCQPQCQLAAPYTLRQTHL